MTVGTDDERRANLTALIEEAISRPGSKPQHEIARLLGYPNSNIITMIKKGKSRLPLRQVVPMAGVLGEDPAKWLRARFEAFEPEALPEIEKNLGFALTSKEEGWVRGLRKLFGAAGIPSFDAKLIS